MNTVVEADGTTGSDEMSLTPIDKETFSIKLRKRKHGDESPPDIDTTMKRVKRAKKKPRAES